MRTSEAHQDSQQQTDEGTAGHHAGVQELPRCVGHKITGFAQP